MECCLLHGNYQTKRCGMCHPKPRILVLGHGRHGKDTVAEILKFHYGLEFTSSSMTLAAVAIRPALEEAGIVYPDLESCYEDRVNHRAFWYDTISAYNDEDPAKLAKLILNTGDMYVGMRAAREYKAAKSLFNYVLWVDASGRGVPPEDISSMDIEFDPDTMHWIDNSGSLPELETTVEKWYRSQLYGD